MAVKKEVSALTKVWNKTSGWKTYAATILMVVWSGLKAQGFIDQPTYELGLAVLGALGLAALRSAI